MSDHHTSLDPVRELAMGSCGSDTSLGREYAVTHVVHHASGQSTVVHRTFVTVGRLDPGYGSDVTTLDGASIDTRFELSREDHAELVHDITTCERAVASAEATFGRYSEQASAARRRLDNLPHPTYRVREVRIETRLDGGGEVVDEVRSSTVLEDSPESWTMGENEMRCEHLARTSNPNDFSE